MLIFDLGSESTHDVRVVAVRDRAAVGFDLLDLVVDRRLGRVFFEDDNVRFHGAWVGSAEEGDDNEAGAVEGDGCARTGWC